MAVEVAPAVVVMAAGLGYPLWDNPALSSSEAFLSIPTTYT